MPNFTPAGKGEIVDGEKTSISTVSESVDKPLLALATSLKFPAALAVYG